MFPTPLVFEFQQEALIQEIVHSSHYKDVILRNLYRQYCWQPHLENYGHEKLLIVFP